ncbi:MAG: fused MFS/spermidine synthase [Myxococcales bacterium]|nr:fused MFS/spermidine synthase [Myxococcales bacterium]
MDELAATVRRNTASTLLLPLFFLSGATALAYQTLWVRELLLVFGTSTFAISTVLAAFMAGLAMGGFAMARYADTVRRPLQVYGLLEIAIGAYALVFPILVRWLAPLYLDAWRALEPGPISFGLIQFALVGVALLAPTAAMGATLPLLARFATQRLGAAGDRVGTLYAVNTFGAVVGTALCGFVLLPGVGRFNTTVIAALANLLLGVGAVALSRWAGGRETEVADDLEDRTVVLPALLPVSVAIGLAGFSALVYEVAWTRLLGLMLGASTYTFSIMLLAFLVGIAAGGKIGGPLADRLLAERGQASVLYAFAAIEVGIAVVSYITMYLYPELPFFYVRLFDVLGAEDSPSAVWWVSMVVAAVVMTPAAVLMGVHFPLAVRAVVGREDALGGPVGIIYGANTLGGVFGAFLAGFVLLPNLWVQGTLFVAAMGEVVAAGLLILWASNQAPDQPRWLVAAPIPLVALAILLGVRPPWDPMMMTAGMYHYVSHFEDHSREGIIDYSVGDYELVFYEEGLSTVVTVAQNLEEENVWLANNGKVDASTSTDMPTQLLCSLLPMQFVDDPEDVLVIGLASGITAGAVTLVPDVQRLDVVELEPAIERAARYFDAYNHSVLDDPRLSLIHNDGRNHVLLTEPGTYDVIVSEPSNPWISGVSNLFTREFLEMGKQRLKPGGVWSQWVQMYGMGESDLRTLLKTFAAVYDHVIVYATIEDADLVLIGADHPLVPSEEQAAKLLAWPDVEEQLWDIGIEEPIQIVAMFQLDRHVMVELGEDYPYNTDDNMIIEYSAPLHLHLDTQVDNFELLMQSAVLPPTPIRTDPEGLARLARAYNERESVVRAVSTMAESLKRTSDPELKAERLAEADAWQQALEEQLAELEEEAEEEEDGDAEKVEMPADGE